MRAGTMLALINGGVAGVTGVAAGHNLLKILGNIVVTPCAVSAFTRCNTAEQCNSRKAQFFLLAAIRLDTKSPNGAGFSAQAWGAGEGKWLIVKHTTCF